MWIADDYFNWSTLERCLILHIVQKPVIIAWKNSDGLRKMSRTLLGNWYVNFAPPPQKMRTSLMNLHFASLGRAGQDDKAVLFFISHSWSIQRLCEPKCMNASHYSTSFSSKVYYVIALPPVATANKVRLYHYACGPDCATYWRSHGDMVNHMLTPWFWSISLTMHRSGSIVMKLWAFMELGSISQKARPQEYCGIWWLREYLLRMSKRAIHMDQCHLS